MDLDNITKYNNILNQHLKDLKDAKSYIEKNNILGYNQDLIEEEADYVYNCGNLYLALMLYNYASYANLMISRYTKAAYYHSLYNQCRHQIMLKLIALLQ